MAHYPTPEQARALQRISAATRKANALTRAEQHHEARMAWAEAKQARAAYRAIVAPATKRRSKSSVPADLIPTASPALGVASGEHSGTFPSSGNRRTERRASEENERSNAPLNTVREPSGFLGGITSATSVALPAPVVSEVSAARR